jgi:serine/threonine protein kinase
VQSPERLIGVKHSFASDIWSFGLLARFLAVGQFPLPIEDPPSVFGFKSSVVDSDVSHLPIFPLGKF